MFKQGSYYPWPYPIKDPGKPMTVSVPLCYLPNSKVQTFEVRTMRRSLFQIEYLLQVSRLPSFGYFVTVAHNGNAIIVTEDNDKPFHVMWYDRDGILHTVFLGSREVFSEVFTPGYPVDPDSVIYRVRTE